VRPAMLVLNEVAAERVAFLRAGHSRVKYRCGWEAGSEGEQAHASSAGPVAWADEDLVRGILTNLLENAAEALPECEGGRVEVRTGSTPNYAWVEVHDSGPGLPEPVRRSLFEPAISFKKRGMGLGLSIARKNALACGGELRLIESALGGAGFRLELPLPAEGMAGRERAASQQAGQNLRQTHGGKTGVAGDAAKVRA
jgi:two-component system, NtrC family, nitrogen regulation sensor histidine kinase NtrY